MFNLVMFLEYIENTVYGYFPVCVCFSSRQMVLVEDDGEISSSADKSSLLLDGYNFSNCVVVSAVHSGS